MALADKAFHNCLVQVFLGSQSTSHTFSLSDMHLGLDEMEEMHLDIHHYLIRMANTLAFMHWAAKLDARDVKFAIAQANSDTQAIDFGVLGRHALWILDFDRCCTITMDKDGVRKAARVF
ncbi:hypothetical protein F4808DRAFT_459660 [Astrocystis sublimbata]|nr:hypothetical protein F4808DRAFT_459660 [Astrocystis sublimbata]